MAVKVFIDGEAGTTGLQIRERLERREDIVLVRVDPDRRKDPEARLAAFREADCAILCLPDAASKEIVAETREFDTRIIDASTAHRVDPDWVYGFAELKAGQREAIAGARLVANVGCYATGAIAMAHPLVAAGALAADAALSFNAVSGYSGGGKSLIAEYGTESAPPYFLYKIDQHHKHVPEIMKYAGLSVQPVFSPSVGRFEQGMIVQMPLHVPDAATARRLTEVLEAHYDGQTFVSVVPADSYGDRMDPTRLNGTNQLELSVHGSGENGCVIVTALLDNLGKGASGAAVQNLNIMFGLPEGAGL